MLENAAVVTLLSLAALGIAYWTYGRFLARTLYQLDATRPTPSHTLEDGIDYVPTRVPVLFGHHFASIAGLGPILGPAIAVIWGWVPAVLWIIVGCIFIGASHDLGALVVSLRFRGRSIGDVCRELIGPRSRLLALLIIFFLLALAMGAFVLAIAGLFVKYNPDAIIPSFGLMLVAMVIGVAVYKLRFSLGPATAVGLVCFAGLIYLGVRQPVLSYEWFLSPETQRVINEARDTPASPEGPGFAAPYGAADAVKFFHSADRDEVADEILAVSDRTQHTWIALLLGYAFVASILPVWLLLQPRDYINSFQLYFALATLVLGLTVAAMTGAPESRIDAMKFRPDVPDMTTEQAVAKNLTVQQAMDEGFVLNSADGQPLGGSDTSAASADDDGSSAVALEMPLEEALAGGVTVAQLPLAPAWFPLLFVTIACGAVSGFHSLVSSGTTVRQLNKETDALPIGYGAMLVEGVLAILVVMACAAGLGAEAWQSGHEYGSWSSMGGAGLAVQLSAVVQGGANFLKQLGIPPAFGSALLAVTIVAFAMTTLDTATRLLRFNVEEICRSLGLRFLANRFFASLVAVAAIAFFAVVLSSGGKVLWLMFGTTNQLLAGLTLLTVSVFLYKLRRPIIYTIIPMLLMFGISAYAMFGQLQSFFAGGNWAMVTVTLVILGMALWLIVESLLSFARGRGGLDFSDPSAGEQQPAEQSASTPE